MTNPDRPIVNCAQTGCGLRTRHFSGRCPIHWPHGLVLWDGGMRPLLGPLWDLWAAGAIGTVVQLARVEVEVSPAGLPRGVTLHAPGDAPAVLAVPQSLLGLDESDGELPANPASAFLPPIEPTPADRALALLRRQFGGER